MTYKKLNKAERAADYLKMIQEQYEIEVTPSYTAESLDTQKNFLIVCEGQNTEKHYFEAFPVASAEVKVIGGFGGGKGYLVEQARKYSEDKKYEGYEVWCVFDLDVKLVINNQKEDFNNAIARAKGLGFQVAFSNDCFELWFVLHEKLVSAQHHRTEYFDMLTDSWKALLSGKKYEDIGKSKDICGGLYKHLLPGQGTAIKHAKRLWEEAQEHGAQYYLMNPCTTVFELVEELNKYLRP